MSSLLAAACAVPAEDAPGDEAPAHDEDALTTCVSLSGTYKLAPGGCTGTGASDPNRQPQTCALKP